MGDPDPELPARVVPRASDADRERTAELLREAAGRGQLDVEELDERLARAFAARTRAELATLSADVVHDDAQAPPAAIRPGEGGERWVVSVLSGNDRRGHWWVGPRVRVVNVMGGAELDLSEAELSGPTTEITVVSIMGGSEIRVPAGARVEVTRIGLMGGNDVKLGPQRPAADAPLIRLRLFALMGGNEVRRGPRRSRAERRLERERHRHGHPRRPPDPPRP